MQCFTCDGTLKIVRYGQYSDWDHKDSSIKSHTPLPKGACPKTGRSASACLDNVNHRTC